MSKYSRVKKVRQHLSATDDGRLVRFETKEANNKKSTVESHKEIIVCLVCFCSLN